MTRLEESIANREAYDAWRTSPESAAEALAEFTARYGEAIYFTTEPRRRFVCTPHDPAPKRQAISDIRKIWNHPDAIHYRAFGRQPEIPERRDHWCANCQAYVQASEPIR